MARPSKLTDAQWEEIHKRLVAGETARKIGADFGVSDTAIRKRFGDSSRVGLQSLQVRTVASKLAEAQTALEALPVSQRPAALSLAESLRQIGQSMAAAATLSAATSHRLHALANQEAQKIDDADPLAYRDHLMGVQALAKMGNEAGMLPMQMIQAAAKAAPTEETEPAQVLDASALPTEMLTAIMDAKRAAH